MLYFRSLAFSGRPGPLTVVPLERSVPIREYVKHLASVARAVHGALDIGAYEF